MNRLSTEQATQLAKICHNSNRAYCQTIGDDSQVEWEDAPEWQKRSAIEGVHFHAHNPDADASASHEAWMRTKMDDGWKHGITKDQEAKLHPCIVPFSELPVNQQAKDYLFKSIVHSLIVGLQF